MRLSGLNQIDSCKKRTDEYRFDDTLHNLEGLLGSMSWDLTKLFSFFSNGNWETSDRDLIINERENGLEKLKNLYRK